MSRHRIAIAAPFLALALAAPAASAQPALTPPSEAAPPPSSTTSYARSIATADGVAGAMFLGGGLTGIICLVDSLDFEEDSPSSPLCPLAATLLIGSAATYAIVPAVIHSRHGNAGKAVLSTMLRIGLPAAGLALGQIVDNDDVSSFGFLGGVGAAVAIDWFALAQDEAPPPRPSFQPTVTPLRGGAAAGVAGSF